jgi:hypothetical protein
LAGCEEFRLHLPRINDATRGLGCFGSRKAASSRGLPVFGLGIQSRITEEPRRRVRRAARALPSGSGKGLVSHLKEMDAAEYLDEADAVERPLFDREI